MRLLTRDSWRAATTAALLVFSLLATTLLALQAQAAYLYHRTTAEQALRDFARLAASEFVRRGAAHVGYDGYAVLLPALAQRTNALGPARDLARTLADSPEARPKAAARLARRFLAAAPASERIVWSPDPPPPEAVAWLQARLAERTAGSEAFAALHAVLGGEPRSFVVAPARAPSPWSVIGFEVELGALSGWLRATLERGPLLPPFVGQGGVGNDSLFVSFVDHGGVERLRAGEEAAASLAVEEGFGRSYSGVLDGSRVRLAIGQEAARRLVIGGLPRSRLPLLLGLLALSAGLVATALLQLRRERALQRLRAEFVASVSHELRTPLAQIRMFAETLLLERVRSDEERRRALEIVDREARRLAHLVENVLQFSRGERGTLPLLRERRPLAPLVQEVLEQFEPLAAGSGARLAARLDESAAAAVDADALRQILLNLLDNAVKYGPRGQELIVALEPTGSGARLSVDDQGPGIPLAERRRVFERFQRLARDSQKAVAGTGIGLAVVRDLVERHGGRAFVEDGSRGGARLVVELPA